MVTELLMKKRTTGPAESDRELERYECGKISTKPVKIFASSSWSGALALKAIIVSRTVEVAVR